MGKRKPYPGRIACAAPPGGAPKPNAWRLKGTRACPNGCAHWSGASSSGTGRPGRGPRRRAPRRQGRDAEGPSGRRVGRRGLGPLRPCLRSRRATGPGRDRRHGRKRHRRSLAGQDGQEPHRIPSRLDSPPPRHVARRRGRGRVGRPVVPRLGPLGPGEGTAPGHGAARGRGRHPPARRRRGPSGHRPQSAGGGRRVHGPAVGPVS